MAVRGVRGATTARANSAEAILTATRELLDALVEANHLNAADVASIGFTTTPDLDSAFPAAAVRALGWNDVAAIDTAAPSVVGDVARCIRVLIHWNTDLSQSQVRHAYLHGARVLRPDRADGESRDAVQSPTGLRAEGG